MSVFTKVKKYLTSPEYRFKTNYDRGVYDSLSDKDFLIKKYKMVNGIKLDLDDPKTFCEKIQYLKIYDRNPLYTVLQDKYLVRDHVAKLIGEEHLIPLLAVYDSADDIDFDALPDQFVLKCNHDSNSVVICRDKASLDTDKVRKKLAKRLAMNFWDPGKEWAYKDIPHKIVAEKYMQEDGDDETDEVKGLRDYKFFCFGGEPKFAYVSKGLENHSTAKMVHLNLDWTRAPFQRTGYAEFDKLPEKPSRFDEMLEICKKLSDGIPFVRIDLYEINGKVYFGEYTFYPASGSGDFVPKSWNTEIGSWIDLTLIKH